MGALFLEHFHGAVCRIGVTDTAFPYREERFNLLVLAEWIDQTTETIEAISASAAGDLTPAELRVLRFLPTHLSFPQIAAQAYLSPNTVKTQAQSIYRKLGVSSRREAVERARAAGLLDAEGVTRTSR